MPKVFLGGTVNGATWRDYLMPRLEIDYYNPVKKEWDEESYRQELHEREICDFCLYVLSPKMTGVYSVAEAVDDSNKRPEKTLFCCLPKDEDQSFSAFQLKSMEAVRRMVENNGAKTFDNLDEILDYLNQKVKV